MQGNEGTDQQEQASTWEEEKRESKYARGLEQLPADRKISPNPADWECEFTGVKENLWLNLSTGKIGSGRRHWDGSGGNGAIGPVSHTLTVSIALQHSPFPQKMVIEFELCSTRFSASRTTERRFPV
jgi:uncharacterized UBP type Zn finger protein